MQGFVATVVSKSPIASVQLFCLQPGALPDKSSRLLCKQGSMELNEMITDSNSYLQCNEGKLRLGHHQTFDTSVSGDESMVHIGAVRHGILGDGPWRRPSVILPMIL